MTNRPIDNLIAKSSIGAGLARAKRDGIDAELEDLDSELRESGLVPLVELQAESARTNEANGVIAFLVGVVHRVHSANTVEEARTIATMALESITEWHAGTWKPGPHDNAADWNARAKESK